MYGGQFVIRAPIAHRVLSAAANCDCPAHRDVVVDDDDDDNDDKKDDDGRLLSGALAKTNSTLRSNAAYALFASKEWFLKK